MRANAIHLTYAQRWQVAKYCIEHKGVVQDQFGKFTIFRVGQSTLVREFNESGADFVVTLHTLKESVTFYNIVAELTNNLPEIPSKDEMDSDLEAEYKQAVAELQTSKGKLQKIIDDQNVVIANLMMTIQEIRRIAQNPGKTPEVKKLHGGLK